jgi:hypothetical protein
MQKLSEEKAMSADISKALELARELKANWGNGVYLADYKDYLYASSAAALDVIEAADKTRQAIEDEDSLTNCYVDLCDALDAWAACVNGGGDEGNS